MLSSTPRQREEKVKAILDRIEQNGRSVDPLYGERDISVPREPPTSMPPELRGLLYEPLVAFNSVTPSELYYSPVFYDVIAKVFADPDVTQYIDQKTQSSRTTLRSSQRPMAELMMAMAIGGIEPAQLPLYSVMEAMRHHPSYPLVYDFVKADMAKKERMQLMPSGHKVGAVTDADHEYEILRHELNWLGTPADYERDLKNYQAELEVWWEERTAKGSKAVPDVTKPIAPKAENYWEPGKRKEGLEKLMGKPPVPELAKVINRPIIPEVKQLEEKKKKAPSQKKKGNKEEVKEEEAAVAQPPPSAEKKKKEKKPKEVKEGKKPKEKKSSTKKEKREREEVESMEGSIQESGGFADHMSQDE